MKKTKDKIHILVVEDSPDSQETLKVMILGLECDLTISSTAEDALLQLKNGLSPDMILLDFKLPGMSGPQFANQILLKEMWRDIPIIPYTAQWNEDLEKPYQKDLQIIKDWISVKKYNDKVGGNLGPIIPKLHGLENNTSIPGKLIVQMSAALINRNKILPPTFERTLLKLTTGI